MKKQLLFLAFAALLAGCNRGEDCRYFVELGARRVDGIDVIDAIGNTPLIKLKRVSEMTGCTILGKAEFMNPGQSVKDRAGREMILQAEKRGEIRPGGLVVESTAGNTGIGLALVANARGYRTLIVIPETQSQEKKDMLRLCGAELVEVPAVPYSNQNNYQHVGRRLAESRTIQAKGIASNTRSHAPHASNGVASNASPITSIPISPIPTTNDSEP